MPPTRTLVPSSDGAGPGPTLVGSPPAASAWPQVASLAARQHGAVSRRQLLGLGLSGRQIDGAAKAGRLHRVHRGVFAVGHPRLSELGRWSAAVLACGSGAGLGYRSAAVLWALRASSAPTIELVVPRNSRSVRTGVLVHRHPDLASDELTVHHGIVVTSVARTLLDLASVVSADQLRRAIGQAETLELFDLRAVTPLLDRRPRHRGARPLAAALESWTDLPRTRSALEEQFPELCRRHGLPTPLMNSTVDGIEVDALFPDHGVAVELDGRRFHAGRTQWENDHERRARLVAAGWTLLAFTYRQVTADDGRFVAETLGAVLRRRA